LRRISPFAIEGKKKRKSGYQLIIKRGREKNWLIIQFLVYGNWRKLGCQPDMAPPPLAEDGASTVGALASNGGSGEGSGGD